MWATHSIGKTERPGQWMEKDMHSSHPVSRRLYRNKWQNTHPTAFKHEQRAYYHASSLTQSAEEGYFGILCG